MNAHQLDSSERFPTTRLTRRRALSLLAVTTSAAVINGRRGTGTSGIESGTIGGGPPRDANTAYAFVRAWGGPGIGDGQFRYPCHLAVDRRGRLPRRLAERSC